MSDQNDLVIHDCQYSPLLFLDEAGLYIAAESVYAVFEVKQDLSREHIEYAGEKVASVERWIEQAPRFATRVARTPRKSSTTSLEACSL